MRVGGLSIIANMTIEPCGRFARIRRREPFWSSSAVLALCVAFALVVSIGVRSDLRAQAATGVGDSSRFVAEFLEDWRWRVFDREEGLSSQFVTCLFQDRDDYIYAATDVGVCRYDLHRWEILENAEAFDDGPITRIVSSHGSVFCATATSLWATERGGPLKRLFPKPGSGARDRRGRIFVASDPRGGVYLVHERRDGSKKHYSVTTTDVQPLEHVRPPEGRVLDYQIDESRVHWMSTSQGMQFRDMRENRWIELDGDQDFDLPFAHPICSRFLAFDKPREAAPTGDSDHPPTGRRVLWGVFHPVGEPTSWVVGRLEGESWRQMGRRIEDVAKVPVEGVVNDRDGNHIATCEDGSVFVLPAASGGWFEVGSAEDTDSRLLQSGIVDSAGHLWFLRRAGGVTTFDGQSRRWQAFPGLGNRAFPTVRTLLEAKDGSLWAGTGSGVIRYVRDDGTANDRSNDLLGNSFSWSGWRLDRHWEAIHDSKITAVTGLAEDTRGHVWISSAGGFDGAYRYDGSRWVTHRPKGLGDAPVLRIVSDKFDELWFVAGQARDDDEPTVYHGSRLTGYDIQPVVIDGASGRGAIEDLVRVSQKELWLASSDGLYECAIIRGRIVVQRRFSVEDGLKSNKIWVIEQGPRGGLWFSYSGPDVGVARISGGVIDHFGVSDGLPNAEVLSITADRNGLWFGTGAGITRFDGECWYSVKVASETESSNVVMPILPTESESGRSAVFVGTLVQGVYRFELDDVRRPRFTSTELPTLVTAGRSAEFGWDARDHRNRSAPSDLLFRYRVDENDWTSFSTARRATISGLTEGAHTLEIEVRDLDGNRSRETISHRFVVDARSSVWPFLIGGGAIGLVILLGAAELARRRLRDRAALFRRYHGLFVDNPSAVFIVDESFRVLDYNGACRESLGLADIAASDVIGRPLSMVSVFSGSRVRDFLRVSRAECSGDDRSRRRSGMPVRTMTVSGDASGDRETAMKISVYPVAGGSMSIHVDDVSGEAETQKLAKRNDRLRSVSDLASRVHDGLDELIGEHARRASSTPRAGRLLDVLRKIADLDASRLPTSSVDLDHLLDTLLEPIVPGGAAPLRDEKIAQMHPVRELPKPPPGVRVDYRHQVGLWPVVGETDALSEAMWEILTNAFEAMPNEGDLVVRANNLQVDEDPGELPAGPYVEVSIKDVGRGIDPAQLEAIFDPFYSTKPRDRALGVGLSIAYTIVRRCGGDLRVWSRPSVGTTVRVLLPARRGA